MTLKFLDDSLLLDLDHCIMSTIQSDPVINDEKRSLVILLCLTDDNSRLSRGKVIKVIIAGEQTSLCYHR